LLIAQPFTKDEYFWPRPSAASYDAGASSSSALAPSNPTLRGNVAGYVGPVVRYKTGDKAGQQVATTTFDDWQQAHPDVQLQEVPADMVTTSGSGLDPHITLANAEFQLPRVAGKWAANTHRPVADVQREIEQILKDKALAPWNGLAGEKLVNVLEVNIELRERYGPPQ
jgi:K+-transporting ATPase c subunit